jgi:hypothetical protein
MARAKVVTFKLPPSGIFPDKPMPKPPDYAAVIIRERDSQGAVISQCRAIVPFVTPGPIAYLRLGVSARTEPDSNQAATDCEWDVENTCDFNCDNYCDCETACEGVCETACDCFCYCDCADCNCACDCETECGACYCDCGY